MENLDLIDWRMVGFASLWISGLAVILTTVGFADYHAAISGEKLRVGLGRPHCRIAINLGLALFSLGLLGSSAAWWEMVLWGLLAAAFVGYAVRAFRKLLSERTG